MRIHIGKITPALADRIDELEKRLLKYAPLTSKLSLHRKPYGDFYFAFVDMDIDQKQYSVLRNALNGVTFMQSKLEVKVANPNKIEFHKPASNKPDLNPDQIKRAKSVHPRKINVFPGRFRPDVRPNPTFRTLLNGEVKKFRLKKRKLWGVEKRPIDQLVYQFENGEWLDSNNKKVEILAELTNEHLRDQRIANDVNNTDFLSDSDFDDFKANSRVLELVESDNEIEVVPSFPTNNETENKPQNQTDKLRDMFSADTKFSLIEEPVVAEEPPKFGLFFQHKSHFLKAQAQSSKLVTEFDLKKFESEFYERRSEYKKELKQRQRDVLRRNKRLRA